ncbi:MAG: hypothetical protein ACSLFO_02380, partial [Acidimicrobiales bacterium]
KRNWTETSAVNLLTEIRDVVESNGAVLESGGCELIAGGYGIDNDEADVIGPCEGIADLSEDVFRTIAGVRVTVSDTRDVPFSAFVEQDDITGSAVAAASIQPVVEVSEGWSVFMLCTSPSAVGHPAQALVEDPADPTGYSVREEAHGKVFVLWGNEVKAHDSGRDCGKNSSDWRGLIRYDLKFPLPSTFSAPPLKADDNWWRIEEGNASGTIEFSPNVLGPDACELSGEDLNDLEIGCMLAVPLCPFSNQGGEMPAVHLSDDYSADYRLFCPRMGIFKISHIGSTFDETVETDPTAEPPIEDYETPCGVRQTNIICGRFQGSAVAKDGQGSAENPDQYDYVVIKLVE